MWCCFLPVAAEVGGVDPLTIEVRLMIEAVLQYSLYRLFDPVDLEGALVSLFHQIFGRRRAIEVKLVAGITCK